MPAFIDRLLAKKQSLPPPPDLSTDQAMEEARTFLTRSSTMSETGRERLLAAMLQRVHQEGVCAGYDRAADVIKYASGRRA